MRFMMFIHNDERAEAGQLPDAKLVEEMMKYNEKLAKAGALIALDGLHPTSKGARVRFSGGKPTITDGPFAESKEIIGGYWIIDVKSKQEALEWAKQVPVQEAVIDVRQIFEMTDFPEDVRKAADNYPAVHDAVEKHKK
jgi:hypothetical protein